MPMTAEEKREYKRNQRNRWNAANRERFRESQRRWRAANREKWNAYMREYAREWRVWRKKVHVANA